MTVFALADTHLSLARPKPMDVFGELWRGHDDRLAAAWDASVGENDVVLVAGDVSWARNLAEAGPDLAFIAERPGRLKILLRGNHDSWWASPAKLRQALPAGIVALQNDAVRLPEGIVVCGARGWNLPGMPWSDPEKDPPIFRRELERLDLSLADAARRRQPGDTLLAMLHYPPLGPEDSTSPVLERLAATGVRKAVFGHLHGADHAWAPRGARLGVELVFVAVDYTGFVPVPVWTAP